MSVEDLVERPLPLTPNTESSFTCGDCGKNGGWHLVECKRLPRERWIARWFAALTMEQWLSVHAWLELENRGRPAADNVVPFRGPQS